MAIATIDTTFWKNKNVLLTGHTGFKGAWLCMLLSQLGARITGYALAPATQPSLFELCNLDQLVDSRIADIRNAGQLNHVIEEVKPGIIIHMAAQSLVLRSYDQPVETYEVNVMGTVNVLEAVRQHSFVKVLLNVTSDKCYENKEWLGGYRETDPLGGYDPYSSSKACAELVSAAYTRSFFKEGPTAIATARAGNVVGGGDWSDMRLVPDFVRAIENGRQLVIRNPESIRPWQHVLEPLTGYLMLIEKLYTDGTNYAGAWNFGPEEKDERTVKWLAQKLCTSWGNGVSCIIEPATTKHEAGYLKLDSTKAKQLLHWHPRWNIELAIESIIDFSRAYIAGESLYEKSISQIKDYLSA